MANYQFSDPEKARAASAKGVEVKKQKQRERVRAQVLLSEICFDMGGEMITRPDMDGNPRTMRLIDWVIYRMLEQIIDGKNKTEATKVVAAIYETAAVKKQGVDTIKFIVDGMTPEQIQEMKRGGRAGLMQNGNAGNT